MMKFEEWWETEGHKRTFLRADLYPEPIDHDSAREGWEACQTHMTGGGHVATDPAKSGPDGRPVIGCVNAGNVTGFVCPACRHTHAAELCHEGINRVDCLKCTYLFWVDKNRRVNNLDEFKKIEDALKAHGFQLLYGSKK